MDNTCAAACVADHLCGAQNPTRVNTSTITTMSATTTGGAAASTASDGVIYTGFGTESGASATAGSGGSGSSSSSAAARLVVNFGQIYGLAVVGAGIFAGFTLML